MSLFRNAFKRLHYPIDVIAQYVRWYPAYALSLRNLEEMMAERGILVDHSTLHRWVICADLSLNNVTDAEAFPGLIRQTHRKIKVASADGAYDTKRCHDELRRKKIKALIPPRARAGYWPTEYMDRNQAVARQRLTGSNAYWKWNTAYNRRSVAETAMYRVKQLLGGYLTLRDYDAQFSEAMAMIRALNKMTLAGMPKSVRVA